jgi:hypothetical protein
VLNGNDIQQDATLKIQQLTHQSIELCRNNPVEGIKQAEEIIALATSIQSDSDIAIGKACKGSCLVWLGHYDTALQALFEALPQLQEIGNKKTEAHARYHVFCSYYFLQIMITP